MQTLQKYCYMSFRKLSKIHFCVKFADILLSYLFFIHILLNAMQLVFIPPMLSIQFAFVSWPSYVYTFVFLMNILISRQFIRNPFNNECFFRAITYRGGGPTPILKVNQTMIPNLILFVKKGHRI